MTCPYTLPVFLLSAATIGSNGAAICGFARAVATHNAAASLTGACAIIFTRRRGVDRRDDLDHLPQLRGIGECLRRGGYDWPHGGAASSSFSSEARLASRAFAMTLAAGGQASGNGFSRLI